MLGHVEELKMVAQASCSKRKRDARVSNNSSSNSSKAMPLVDQKGPPSPTMLGSRCEDEGRSASSTKKPRPANPNDSAVASATTSHQDEDMEDLAPPMSPRVRKRLDDAKENASLFGPGEKGALYFF